MAHQPETEHGGHIVAASQVVNFLWWNLYKCPSEERNVKNLLQAEHLLD